jgi:hypothetical protein
MKFFPELVTLFYKFELFWGKMVGFVSDGVPAGIKDVVTATLK